MTFRKPHRQHEGGELMPERLFPDHAFADAARTNRKVMRIILGPPSLEWLRRELTTKRWVRHTAFDDRPSPKGAVPDYSARYRGIELTTHRQMEGQFLAEFTDGSLQYYKLDECHHVMQPEGPRF